MLKRLFLLLTVFTTTALSAAVSTEHNYAFVTFNSYENIATNYVVPFVDNPDNVIGSDITFDDHSLQVSKSGTYKLNYNIIVQQVNGLPSKDIALSAGISVNGVQQFTEIESSQWGLDVYAVPVNTVNPTRCLRISIHHYLNAGDKVALVLRTNNNYLGTSKLNSSYFSGDMTANLSLYRIENERLPFIYGTANTSHYIYSNILPNIPFVTWKENPTGNIFTPSPDNRSIYINQPGVYMASFQASANVTVSYKNNFRLLLNGTPLSGSQFGAGPLVYYQVGQTFQDNIGNDCMFYANAGDIVNLQGNFWNPSSLGSTSVALNIIKISGNQTKPNKAENTFGYFNGTKVFYPNDSSNVTLFSSDAATNPDFTYIDPTQIKFRVGGNYKITYQLNFVTPTATENGVAIVKPFKTQILRNGQPVTGSVWGVDLKPYNNQSQATNKISVDFIFTANANDIISLNVAAGSWNLGLGNIQRSTLGLASAGLSIMKVSDSN